jgi:hypothetical protein
VKGRLVYTGLGSSFLAAHVLHYPPPPHANSFVIGTAVIDTHTPGAFVTVTVVVISGAFIIFLVHNHIINKKNPFPAM